MLVRAILKIAWQDLDFLNQKINVWRTWLDEEAPRLRVRIEETQSEKAGTRSGETLNRSPKPKQLRAWASAHARLPL